MLVNWVRVFTKDNTVYADKSFDNENESAEIDAAFVAAEDALYIGKVCPFNNFYSYIGTANTNSSTMSIEYWDSSQWRAAVDVIDGTSSSGKTLAQNGGVVFVPNKLYGWQMVEDTSDTVNAPSDLQDFTLYDLYWLRIKFSNDLSAGTTIKRLFYSFTTDQVINSIDKDATNYLTAFGQTSWEPQIFTATKEVLADLKARKILTNEGQLLSLDPIAEPAAYKTLALIYFNLGEDYNDKYEKALNMYNTLLRNDLFPIDQDNNAVLDPDEQVTMNGRLFRV